MPHCVSIEWMLQRLRHTGCCTVLDVCVDNREKNSIERTHCLSDFSRLYGNVMTTKAALHLHGLPVFLPKVVCASTLQPKQIKKFHQNVIGGRVEKVMVARK